MPLKTTTSRCQPIMSSRTSAAPKGIWPPSPNLGTVEARIPRTPSQRLNRLQSLPTGKAVKSLTTTIDDFVDAAIWRLRDWSPLLVERGTDSVADLVNRGIPIAEDQPEVERLMKRLHRDSRSKWSALCALLTLHADSTGNDLLKFSAGLEVWSAQRQARTGERKGNVLSRAIRGHMESHPNVSDVEIFEHFAAVAGEDYDDLLDEITLEPLPGRTKKTINRDAFCKRCRRIRPRIEPLSSTETSNDCHSAAVLSEYSSCTSVGLPPRLIG